MPDPINKSVKEWMIISWQHVDHLDAPYGRLLETVEGTYEEAALLARAYIANFSPVGICGVIK